MPTLPDAPSPISRRRYFLLLAIVFFVALALREARAGQSLWCDEMSTLLEYVNAPWHKILAGGAGDYVPNNHVLSTVLIKLCYSFASIGPSVQPIVSERWLRLPSVICGALLPVVLAWPFQKSRPTFGLLLAIIVAVHPWLVVFSAEARGYSLMLLLGGLATNLLPLHQRRRPFRYGLCMALAMYTIPVAILLLIAHGLAVLILDRKAIVNWLVGAVIAMGIALVLYLPLMSALLSYYQHPLPGPDDFFDFVNQLPRFALWAEYRPRLVDPLISKPGFSSGIWVYLVSLTIALVGSCIAWRDEKLRPVSLGFGLTIPVALAAAVAIHAAGQVRFVPWSALLICIDIAAILCWIGNRYRTASLGIALIGVVALMGYCDAEMSPSQPIREATQWADAHAEPGQPIVVALLSSPETVTIYGHFIHQHTLVSAPTIPEFVLRESQCLAAQHTRPCVVISFEYLVRDLQPDFWNYLNQHYRIAVRLPGRISPVTVYEPVP